MNIKVGDKLCCIDTYYTDHFFKHPLTLGKKYTCIRRTSTYIETYDNNGVLTFYSPSRFVLAHILPLNNNIKII